jgi:hypothetical protein
MRITLLYIMQQVIEKGDIVRLFRIRRWRFYRNFGEEQGQRPERSKQQRRYKRKRNFLSFVESPLHLAIRESQMWAFQVLIKNGAKFDIINNDKENLIHYAVSGIGNAQQFIRTLVSKGVDVNQENKFGETPLDIAKKKNLSRIADLLKELGAKEKATTTSTSPQKIAPKVI